MSDPDNAFDVDRKFVDGEINDLLDLEDGLSDWELTFIESVNDQLDHGAVLTEKQTAKLHQIWARHLGRTAT